MKKQQNAYALPERKMIRKVRKHMKFGRANVYIRILIPAIMLYALVSLFITCGRLEQAEEALRMAQETVQSLEERNRQIASEIERADDPEMMEQMARRRLGLVMPGDLVIYDTQN